MSLSSSLIKYNEAGFKSESLLLLDLKYLLLGTDSNSFIFSKNDLKINIMFDISKLFKIQLFYLNKFIKLALILKKLSLINSINLSPLLKSFHSCISDSLINFNSFINNLNDLKTFNKLNYYLNDWFLIFKFIYWLYLNSLSLKSYQFLSILYQHTLIGDSLIKDLSLKYFNSCLKSYYNSIINWLLLGNLINDDNFFIKSNNNNNYSFDSNLIPIFINYQTAFKIFQIGKSINFLKNYLNDKIYCNNIYNNYNNSFKKIDLLDNNFNIEINNLYNIIINHLNLLLLNDFKSEISNLNNFLLLNKGDLINSIIKNGLNILNNSSSNLSLNQLINLLQDSINSTSTSKNLNSKIFNRLDARLLNLNYNSNTLGWDLFTLDFKILNPINYLISSTYKEYLKIFNFLFRLSRLKIQLYESWKNSHLIIKLNSKLSSNKRKFDLIRHQFISFLDSIYSYITIEILSINYEIFQNKISLNQNNSYSLKNNKTLLLPFNSKSNKLFNLDDLILIHNNYIYSISKNELFFNINNSKIPINKILYQLTIIIDKFIILSNDFQLAINDFIKINNLINLNSDNELVKYKSLLLDKINKIINNLNLNIVDPYENDLTLFISLLKNSNNESLKYLSQILEN